MKDLFFIFYFWETANFDDISACLLACWHPSLCSCVDRYDTSFAKERFLVRTFSSLPSKNKKVYERNLFTPWIYLSIIDSGFLHLN